MLPSFELDECPSCQEQIDDFVERLSESHPLEKECAPVPQEVAGLLGIAMYCLGLLHERGHPMTLTEYGRSIHVPDGPEGTLT